jgi:hypothetical protein
MIHSQKVVDERTSGLRPLVSQGHIRKVTEQRISGSRPLVCAARVDGVHAGAGLEKEQDRWSVL